MTRKRINIDLTPELDTHLTAIAKTHGATKTEVARALLEWRTYPGHEHIDSIIRRNREVANHARSQSQTARRQAPQRSAQQHPES